LGRTHAFGNLGLVDPNALNHANHLETDRIHAGRFGHEGADVGQTLKQFWVDAFECFEAWF
jgi:hypothetical protein